MFGVKLTISFATGSKGGSLFMTFSLRARSRLAKSAQGSDSRATHHGTKVFMCMGLMDG